FALFCLTNNVADPDLWGHIRFGSDIIERGAIPRFDGYSYTAYGRPWINHEWVAELIFAWLFRQWGRHGIVALRLIGLIILGVMIRRLQKGDSCSLEWRTIAAWLIISTVSYGLCFRPQLFSYFFFTLLLLLLTRKPKGYAVGIVAIFLVWANAHGGFIVGLGAVALYSIAACVNALRKGRLYEVVPALILFAASVAVTLVNPYGVTFWSFLYDSVSMSRAYILEWAPIPLDVSSFMDFKALAVIVILSAVISRRPKTGWLLGLTILCGIASIKHNRHMPFFAIAAAFFLPDHLNGMMERIHDPFGGFSKKALHPLTLPYLIVSICILTAIPLYRGRSAFFLYVSPYQYPVAAVRWMKEQRIGGNCAVFFNWGEYLIWHLHDESKVSIDGRYETVYPVRVIDDNFDFFFAGDEWRNLIDRYPTELVLVHPLNPVSPLMAKLSDWALVFGSDTSLLFAKKQKFPTLSAQPPVVVRVSGSEMVPFP
ncbi:MAG: hypothetical protein P8123_09005, partial [bacterium]